MFQYISGKLIEKSPTSVTVDVHGVGYHILIPISTYAVLPVTTENVKLLTHFVVREDAQLLYGFASEDERRIFRLLLSVSGIGPKMATTVLSGMTVAELKRAIAEGSLVALTGISGIGKKTAERIIIELKEKISLEEKMTGLPGGDESKQEPALFEDAIRDLVELGYKKPNAREAVQKVVKMPEAGRYSVSDVIRIALKYI